MLSRRQLGRWELAPPRHRPSLAALRPEAAAPSVGEMGSWLRPEAARRRLQLGKCGMKLVNREGSRVHLLFEITNNDAP